jgi:peptidoglycan/LPS O-acetylase OafA/YrhL
MNKSIHSNAKKVHINYLDGLRGIASFYVLLVHIDPSVGNKLPILLEIFTKLMRYGRVSVVFFIVLSGYVLMLPVVKSDGHISGGLIGYIKRRSRRILPPFYASLLLCLLIALIVFLLETFTSFRWNPVAGAGPFFPKFSAIDILTHILLIHNLSPDTYMSINPPMWTVATEWQMYFIFPILLVPIWRYFGLTLTVITAFLIGITPTYLLNGLFETASPWFLGLFALGIAAADIGFSQKPKLIAIKKNLPWGLLAIIFTTIGFMTEWKYLNLHIWINESFFGMGAACLLIYCTEFSINSKKLPKLLQILEHPWSIALGGFSYSLYLTHGPILVLMRYCLFYINMPPLMFGIMSYILGVAISLITGYLFYLVFERPFISNILKK